ncbi:hypothetical protein [Saccharibacillus kuerlensis]|uniref:Uncharacterized protein n=1 Tax=Saccharibacillus kuerlensis TaxID=459527 RepID=A0ABQ2KUY3_9BACL|nr:hypothetical protein [Saccharibacillus kuerlensis]GGN94049.1 hypothetical protein GCM10010969_08410 [Saccharibacillus kuerlensis]
MKKVFVASALVSAIVLSPAAMLASTEEASVTAESEVVPAAPQAEISSIDEIYTNDFFNELPKIEDEEMAVYRQIEKYKKTNPQLSDEEVLQYFENSINPRGPGIQASGYDETKATR